MSDISDQRRYYERMMDEIAAEHQKQIDQLRTENAKLLKELEAEHALAETLGHYHEHAKAENEKLRDEQREYQATIDSLVDECADHKAENAKLRKELEESPKCETCEAMLDCDECLRADKPRKDRKRLASENTKLRELCKELLDLCYDAYNQEWGWDDDWALAYEQAKKLGVDDG